MIDIYLMHPSQPFNLEYSDRPFASTFISYKLTKFTKDNTTIIHTDISRQMNKTVSSLIEMTNLTSNSCSHPPTDVLLPFICLVYCYYSSLRWPHTTFNQTHFLLSTKLSSTTTCTGHISQVFHPSVITVKSPPSLFIFL